MRANKTIIKYDSLVLVPLVLLDTTISISDLKKYKKLLMRKSSSRDILFDTSPKGRREFIEKFKNYILAENLVNRSLISFSLKSGIDRDYLIDYLVKNNSEDILLLLSDTDILNRITQKKLTKKKYYSSK